MADHAIQVTIGAKDEATKQIKEIDKQLRALTKQKTTIPVGLSTEDAAKQVAELDDAIAKLRSQKAEIVVEANVQKALDALDEVAGESKKAEQAAAALGKSLGPDLSKGADLDSVVAGFREMGLSLESITANADRLGAKLKEVAATDPGGRLDTAFRRAKGGADELGRSANSSKSVLANMVGNSVQDLGQLSGIAGSAGVAIGQMGEYMADAAAEGEGLGSILGSFGKVALPIAAISVGLGLITSALSSVSKEQEEIAKATKEATDRLLEQSGIFQHFKDAIDPATNSYDAFAQSLDDDQLAAAGNALGALGLHIDDLGKTLIGFDEPGNAFTQHLLEVAGVAPQYSAAIADAVNQADGLEEITGQIAASLINQGMAAKDAAKLAGELVKQYAKQIAATDDLDKITKKIDFETVSTKQLNSARAIDVRTEALVNQAYAETQGKDAVATYTRFLELQTGATTAQAAAMVSANVQFAKTSQLLQNWAEQTAHNIEVLARVPSITVALDDLGGAFSQMAIRSEAMRTAFEFGDAGVKAAEQVNDIADSMRGLLEFINDPKGLKGKIPNILSGRDIHAGPFLDKIRSLRGALQGAITDAFATGGAPAAQATADAYVDQLFRALDGKISKGDLQELLGLTATINIAVDESSKAKAERELELLTSLLGGDTPLTVGLKFALDAGPGRGGLSAEAVSQAAEAEFAKFKIPIPVGLQAPNDQDKVAAVANLQRWLAANPGLNNDNTGVIQTAVATPTTDRMTAAVKGANLWFNDNPATLPVKPVIQVGPGSPIKSLADLLAGHDAGGTVRGIGGIVGERRPEIVNSRYLVTGPTVVPPGTRVTSGARTARILRTRGTRGLRRYDSGGVVAGPSTLNINVNTAVVGNRFDVDRQIRKSGQRTLRLYGSR